MARLVLSSLLVAAKAGTLAVTYQDCGAKHAQVTDLKPNSIHTGATETLTGTGTSDEDVTSAHFTATVSALGATLSECSGDGTEDLVCHLPLGVGKITVKALSFPIAKGTVSIPVEVKTSRWIPASLANVDVHVAAEDQNGESVICLDVHTARTMEEEVKESACTSMEQYHGLSNPEYVGKMVHDCSTQASDIAHDHFDHDNFNDCFSSSTGVSKTCSECYAVAAEYADKNCRASCLLGWCKSGCLACTAPAQEDLATCTGFTPATAEPCQEIEGALAVTFQDCGATHAQVADLQPAFIDTGASEILTGTGTSDEDVTSAHFTATVSAQGSKLSECSGDGTKDMVCDLPLGAGNITVKALSFPVVKGTVSIPIEVKTRRWIPASLANVDVHIAAEDQNGESVICLDVHTAKATEKELVMV